MSDTDKPISAHATWDMKEERFSYAQLSIEVADEHQTGALSTQKLKQEDIQRLFTTKAKGKLER